MRCCACSKYSKMLFVPIDGTMRTDWRCRLCIMFIAAEKEWLCKKQEEDYDGERFTFTFRVSKID